MPRLKAAQLVSQSHWDSGNPYSETHIEKILTCLKVDLTPSARKKFVAELIVHTQNFRASYEAAQSKDNMSVTELRKWLTRGQKTLTEALNVVNHPFQIQRLLRKYRYADTYDATLGKKACIKHLRILCASLKEIEDSLPDGKGDSWPVKQYIRRLKTLYETTTKITAKRSVQHYAGSKSKEAGKFLSFVESALLPLGIYSHNPTGIIRAVLEEAPMDKSIQK